MFKFVTIFALISIFAVAVEGRSPPSHPPPRPNRPHSSGSSDDANAEVRTLTSDVRADGFDYALDISNGIYAAASGDELGNIHGEYHYESPEGVAVKVTYVADENGYQPSSDLLPTPPPTPEAILKALAWLGSHASRE